jgi:NACHT domain
MHRLSWGLRERKTGLLQWLAAELAESGSPGCPIFVSLGEIRQNLPQTIDDLARAANPKLSTGLLNHVIANCQLFVLLDGLDEVVDPKDRGLSQHRPIIDALSKTIPPRSRLVLICRTMFYDAVALDVSPLVTEQFADSTDTAITLALEGEFTKPEILLLCDVMIEDADRYLSQGTSSNVWPSAKDRQELADFLKSPFTLRLLERALPEILTKADVLDLDRLYEVAIRSMLLRDGRISQGGGWSPLWKLWKGSCSRVQFPITHQYQPVSPAAFSPAMILRKLHFHRGH